MRLIKLLPVLIITFLVIGCSKGDGSGEAKKLLDKQEAIEQKDKQNLSETKEQIEETLDEMGAVEDSLNSTRLAIKEQKKKLQDEAARLEAEKLQLKMEKQKAHLNSLSERMDSLNEVLSQTETSLKKTLKDSAVISRNKDSLQMTGKVMSSLDKELQTKLVTGIREIDTKMEELEEQKRKTQSLISLNEKKMAVAERKIEVLNDEKELYESQKQKLLGDGAPQSEIDEISGKIASVGESIQMEKKKVKNIRESIVDHEDTIEGIDRQKKSLSEKIRKNYSTQELLNEFMEEEQQRLKAEVEKLDTAQQKIKSEWKSIARQKEELEENLSNLKERISQTEDTQLVSLREKMATLEKELTDLEKEEENLGKKPAQMKKSKDTAGLSEVEKLQREYREKQQVLAEERAALAKERAEIARQREKLSARQEDTEPEAQKETKKRGISPAGIIVIAAVILIGLGVYLWGRYKNKNKAKTE